MQVSADRLLLMIAKAEDEGRHLRDFFTTSEADGGVPDEALSFAVEGLEERGLVSGRLTLLWPELTVLGAADGSSNSGPGPRANAGAGKRF